MTRRMKMTRTNRRSGSIVLLVVALLLVLAGCNDPCTPCPTTPTPIPPTPTATPAPTMWDGRLSELGLYVLDMPGVWDLEAAWITVAGDWATAPQWAKDRYPWANLGGDHHAYGMAIDKNGVIRSDAGFVLLWPDGGDQRTPQECSHPEWANLALYAGFDWSQTPGPYTWEKFGGDRLVGLGMPYPPLPWQAGAYAMGGVHVSFFGVWRERAE